MFQKLGNWFRKITDDNPKNNIVYQVVTTAMFLFWCCLEQIVTFTSKNSLFFRVIAILFVVSIVFLLFYFVFWITNFIKQQKDASNRGFASGFEFYGFLTRIIGTSLFIVHLSFLKKQEFLILASLLFLISIILQIRGHKLRKSNI